MLVGQVVPEGLAAMPPGPELARALADIDHTRVPNDDIIDVLQARSRQLAYDQAHMFSALSEVIHRLPFAGPSEVRRAEQPELYGPDEVRAALSWTRRAAESETDLAHTLVSVLPLVQAALLDGRIDRGKAWVFARHMSDLSPAQITAICDALLPVAPRLTAGQIAERIKRMILELDPVYYERRYRCAVRDRKVVAYLAPDGSAVISASGLPADEAAAWERLDALARAARHDGHPATLDQIRADLVLGLLDGSLHGLTRAEILQALLERFAGHAEPDNEERADTLVPTGSHELDARPHDPGPDGSGPGGPGHNDPVNSADHDGARNDNAGKDNAGKDNAGKDNGDSEGHSDSPSARRNTLENSQNPPAASPTTTDDTTASPEDQRAGTEIRVPLSTLLELDQRSGELPGWGPIPADAARRIVARQRRAQWRWVIVDEAGHLLAEGITRRRPAAAARGGPRGGIVEIQIPVSLLTTLAATSARHGPWAGVITDITAQLDAGRARGSTMTDLDAHPDDRFPRAALRRHVQIRDRKLQLCTPSACRGVDLDPGHALTSQGGGGVERPAAGKATPDQAYLEPGTSGRAGSVRTWRGLGELPRLTSQPGDRAGPAFPGRAVAGRPAPGAPASAVVAVLG